MKTVQTNKLLENIGANLVPALVVLVSIKQGIDANSVGKGVVHAVLLSIPILITSKLLGIYYFPLSKSLEFLKQASGTLLIAGLSIVISYWAVIFTTKLLTSGGESSQLFKRCLFVTLICSAIQQYSITFIDTTIDKGVKFKNALALWQLLIWGIIIAKMTLTYIDKNIKPLGEGKKLLFTIVAFYLVVIGFIFLVISF